MLKQVLKILLPLFIFTSVFLAASIVSSDEKKTISLNLPELNQVTQQMIDFTSTLTKEEQNYLKTKKVVTMTNNPNWTPIVFANDGDQNDMQGIAIDTLKEIEKRLNIKFKNIPNKGWKKGQLYLKDKKVDILPCYIKTPAREEYANFTRPYLRLPLAIFAAKDKSIVSGLDEVIDKSWTRQGGSGLIPKLLIKYPDMKIIKTKGDIEAFRLVNSGKAYFTIATLPVASHVISKNMFNNLQIIGYTDFIYYLHIAVAKDNQILLSILDKALADISEERSKEIFRKWVHPSIKEPVTDYQQLGQILFVVFVIGIFFIYRQHILKKNIRRLKIVEKQLMESQKKYKYIYDNVQVGLFKSRLVDGKIVMANNKMANMFGYKNPEECIAKYVAIEHYVYPEIRDQMVNSIREHGQFDNFETQIKRDDDSIIWILFSGIVASEKGLFEGFASDITQRKHTEIALNKSEKQFQDLFNSITDLIYTQNMEGCFTSVNPAMHHLFGYEMEEFLGHKASEFMETELQSGFNSRYLEEIKKEGALEGIACYFKKNGEKIYIEYNSALVGSEEDASYISGIGRDVTERVLSEEKVKKLQQQIAIAQKIESIGILAGGIAHDFNNILFPIIGHAEMLLEDIPEDSPFRMDLNQIYAGALRAGELVKQILTFSRQESGELKLIKIQPIIKEALKLIRSTVPTTIDIKQDIQPDCGVIKADPTQIHQIIINLAINAYHAMEETSGKLKIRLKKVELEKSDLLNPGVKPGTYACLTVSDTGKGMDNELIAKIFDPFFTTKKTGKGTGMGLSVVYGIVKNMNGTIQVYSEPGKGTKFQVYLPIVKAVKKQQTTNAEASIQGGSEHILLVDDENNVTTVVKQMLGRLGYQVSSRTSSLEALDAFRLNPDRFNLVITDMQMPNIPGDKLAVELLKIRSDIPILLCTGFSETMSEKSAASIGIKGFLLKPIVMKDLAQKIRVVLDKK
jgi:PAS domain S-box-containing protein